MCQYKVKILINNYEGTIEKKNNVNKQINIYQFV